MCRDFVPQPTPYLFNNAHKIMLALFKRSHPLNQTVGGIILIDCLHTLPEVPAIS